jgi:hypothetical protein
MSIFKKSFVRWSIFGAATLGMAAGCYVRPYGPPVQGQVVVGGEVEVEEDVPADQYEVEPGPRRGYVWVRGHWEHRGRRGAWHWVPGHWESVRAGHQWVPGHWERRGNRSRWIPGHWRRY